jgi:hypothetical protein
MKMTILLTLFFTLSILGGCFSSGTSSRTVTAGVGATTSGSSGTPTPTATPTATSTPTPTPTTDPSNPQNAASDCANPGNGIGNSNTPYRIVNIRKHGFYNQGVPGDRFQSDAERDQAGNLVIPSQFFATDSTMRIRLKALPAPAGHFSNPSPGCRRTDAYTELSVTVGVRKNTDPYGSYAQTFTATMNVGSCSPVVFINSIPQIQGNEEIAIDVFNARSDWQCVQDPFQNPLYCSQLYHVSSQSCWEAQLHVETDFTTAIPGN